jgi:hypothetical protein
MKWFNLFAKNKEGLRFELTSADVDCCPDELNEQLPVTISIVRQIPGSDRPDYWLAKCETPLYWKERSLTINNIIVGCRLSGVEIKKGIGNVTLNIAYVIDESILRDNELSFDKCIYIAICRGKEL